MRNVRGGQQADGDVVAHVEGRVGADSYARPAVALHQLYLTRSSAHAAKGLAQQV